MCHMITEPCMGKKNIFHMDNGKSNIISKARSIRIKVAMTKVIAEGMIKVMVEVMAEDKVEDTGEDINASWLPCHS